MHYLEKQIDGGNWVAIFQSENKSDLVDQITILRLNQLTVHNYNENSYCIPDLKIKYRIIDKDFTDLIEKQLGYLF